MKNIFFFFLPFLILSCTHSRSIPFSKKTFVQKTNKKEYNKFAPMADSHFHIRNYIQEGPSLKEVYKILSDKGIKRAAIFGIPLQQRWDMTTEVSPTYYLHDDQHLYYYSAIDAIIASEYQSLPESWKEVFDPMIVGFNPTDGRAVDHIKNMLLKFPKTFTGIGEFTIKKEIVSGKVAGNPANIEDPALGKILKFAEKVGLIVILHCDIDAMISNDPHEPTYLKALEKLFMKHKRTKIIWGHTGLGRYVKARPRHIEFLKYLLSVSSNLYVDISWKEVAKQFFKNQHLAPQWRNFLKDHSKRIIFGSDTVSPTPSKYGEILQFYQKIWKEIPEDAVKNITYNNYKKLFDEARSKVRLWEKKALYRSGLNFHGISL